MSLNSLKFPLSKDSIFVCGTHAVSLPQSGLLSFFSMKSTHNWFHMWQMRIVSPNTAPRRPACKWRAVTMPVFVSGLFSWLPVFQCSCFDKRYQNTFFHAPRGWWVLVVFFFFFSEGSGVHFLCTLRPRETTVSKYSPPPFSPADAPC